MQLYELNYLLPLTKDGSEAQRTAGDIEALIQEKGGILTRGRQRQKVKLGYPIDEHEQALLFSCEFQIEPSLSSKIREDMDELPLLRTILYKKKVRKTKKKERRRPQASDVLDEEEIKVELDKIEEKLDKILDES